MLKTQKKRDWNWNWEVWAICNKFCLSIHEKRLAFWWSFVKLQFPTAGMTPWEGAVVEPQASPVHRDFKGNLSNCLNSNVRKHFFFKHVSMFLESKSECHWLLCPEHVYYLDFGLLSVHNSAALARAPLLLHRCCNSPQAENLKNSVVCCG